MQIQAPDDSLLSRCISGDGGAWRELHQSLYPAAAAFLRQMGAQREELDDLCQDVFLQVFRYLPRFAHRSELKTWVFKICLSQLARARRRRSLATLLGRLLWQARPQGEPPINLDWTGLEAQRQLELALGRMTPPQRLVFVLYELHGVRGAEIARIANSPAATVRGRLREARRIFEAALADAGRESEESHE